jgi:hypothetical protein
MGDTHDNKRDGIPDQAIRRYAAQLPLADRQKLAEHLRYVDGIPLTEDDVRGVVSKARAAGISREQIRDALVVDDPAQRRIGSLGPAEIDQILAAERPMTL